jgi:hypothetical protein
MLNISLTLKKNNRYIFTNCSQIEQGKWWIVKDSLFLKCENRKFLIDSFNYKKEFSDGLICRNKIDTFIIQNNIIKRNVKYKTKKYFFVLEKKQ